MTRLPLFKDRQAMTMLHKFQRDVAKHPLKASVLGVLTVVMVVFIIKAAIELRPRAATASVKAVQKSAITAVEADPLPANQADADARMKESSRLWEKLREVKSTGASASVAFSFDASFYPPPLVPQDVSPLTAASAAAAPPAPVAVTIDPETARINRIHEQSHALIVKSTLTGNGVTPVAVINQQVLTVGQKIMGFEIIAIRPREVEFNKEGVTLSVRTPDESSTK